MEKEKAHKITGNEPSTGFAYGETPAVSGITIRQLFATNAQKAIISNADTLREITKATNSMVKEQRDAAFFRAVARISVKHADALIDALNN